MWGEGYGFVGGACNCIQISDASRGRSQRVLMVGRGNVGGGRVFVSGRSNGSFGHTDFRGVLGGLGHNSLLCVLDVSHLKQGCGRVLRR